MIIVATVDAPGPCRLPYLKRFPWSIESCIIRKYWCDGEEYLKTQIWTSEKSALYIFLRKILYISAIYLHIKFNAPMTSFLSLVFSGFTSACSVALPRIDISPSLDSAQGEELVLYVMTRCDAENKDRHRQGKDMDTTASARSYSDILHSDVSDGVNHGKNNNHFQNSNASDDGKRTSVTSLASSTPKTFNSIQTKVNVRRIL